MPTLNAVKEVAIALSGMLLLTAVVCAICFGISIFVDWMGWEPDTPEQHQARVTEHERNIESQLPGCEIKTFSDYKGVQHMVVVICDGKRTTSQSSFIWRGKYGVSETTVRIEDAMQ